MPTFSNDDETMSLFIFNQIFARFGILKEIVTDHGSHFKNKMMIELILNLGFKQEHLSPYYPQVNGQVEAVNKSLKTILQWTINLTKSNWHLILYSTLWAYQTSIKTTT
jgi:transposase InsO family protein